MKDFDCILSETFETSIRIDYGIVKGSDTVLLIKAGQDGTIYGFDNKYLELALRINKRYGYSVVCASNFEKQDDSIGHAIDTIKKEVSENPTIYFMGTSNGASLGAYYAYKYEEIKKVLLVNPPLMINLHRIKKGIANFTGEKIIFVIGSYDPSFRYSEIISNMDNPLVSLEIIENADHNFTHMTGEFISLAQKFLL